MKGKNMDTTKTCPKCGKPLASNAPAGLCPECLMQAGFPTGTEPDAETRKHRFPPPSIDELKPHFPQLEILSYIGQGGMGAVYKARQPMLDRYVALKILPPEASGSPGFTERFTREARALARLSHPNIVAVHEFGQTTSPSLPQEERAGERRPSYHYLIMEFVDGVNLREMERTQRLSPTQALSIVPKICEALQYAHDEGVVHRDIKPENILVDQKGRVKIADFGIAKILGAEANDRITGAQHIVGTPHYMAPEQVEKPLSVDHRADIYSVGVVFYEMLTGELPLGRFAAPSKKVQIDVRLDEVVLRALEKEPEQRYQQATQLKTQVESIVSSPPVAVTSSRTEQRPVKGGIFQQWSTIGLWVVAMALFLDFLLPHSWHFSSGLRFGATQPWLFLPNDGYGLIFNPRAISFFSGLVAALTALALIATQRRKLNLRYLRWVGLLAIAILAVGVVRVAVEPFKAVNDAVAPEINPGSTVFVWKIGSSYHAGDIVVYRWFATGYPTKYLLGRITEPSEYGQVAIERRNQPPQLILLSDVVGKVVFNTRSAAGVGQHFSIGQEYFPGGDMIDLTSVDRSSRRIVVRGHYVLRSANSATLSLNITSREQGFTQVTPEQSIRITNGAGAFELIHPRPIPGLPHVTMYDDSGKPFAHLYFGDTEETQQEQRLDLKAEIEQGHSNGAREETWSPAITPGKPMDVHKILDEATKLAASGDYEQALQRHIWYHNHALEHDPSENGTRLSSALSSWLELAKIYPKAKEAMIEIRDSDVEQMFAGTGDFNTFMDLHSLNRSLKNDDQTYSVFKKVDEKNPKLAQAIHFVVDSLLVQKGDYVTCKKYLGDPEARFDMLRSSFEIEMDVANRSSRRHHEIPVREVRPGAGTQTFSSADWDARMKRATEDRFADRVGELIEVLVATGDSVVAEKIVAEAKKVANSPKLDSAIANAKQRIESHKKSGS